MDSIDSTLIVGGSSVENGNELLIIDVRGNLKCHSMVEQDVEEQDSEWSIIPIGSQISFETQGRGFHIKSKKYGYYLVCDSVTSNKLYGSLGNTSCIWQMDPKGRLFTMLGDDEPLEHYIWALNGKLYVTIDEYVASKWIFKTMEVDGLEKSDTSTSSKTGIMICIIIIICLIIYFSVKPKNSR